MAVARPAGSSDGAASRLADLGAVVAAVAGTTDLTALSDTVTASAARVLGADVCSLWAAEGDRLRLVGRQAASPELGDARRVLRRGGGDPIDQAVATGRMVSASSVAEIARRWPALHGFAGPTRSLVALALPAGEQVVGAIGLSFPVDQEFSELDRRYLEVLANCCGSAMARITATRDADESARKLTFLASASAALAASLDYEETLRTVADLAVPELADWCVIDLLEDGAFRRVAISHTDPSRLHLAQRLTDRLPADMDATSGAPRVARTGASELVEQVDDEMLTSLGLSDEVVAMLRDLRLSSGVTVALRARDRTLGVLSLVQAESGRHFGPDDVRFAEDLARRAAQAIDNAQLHTQTLQVALTLQRAVLPATFPDSRTWQVAVHYRPAGRTEVGGDFYDALTLEDQRMIALVGDVMGRGVDAAAAMAQVRSALRAYLALDPDPVRVLGRLDRMWEHLDLPQLVTLCYGVLDLPASRATILSAGHVPPLVVRSGGGVDRLDVTATPPVGAGLPERLVSTCRFGPGDVLLLYTDGLVERRGEDLFDGLDRLSAAAGCLAGGISDATLAALADRLRSAGHDDDVTLLAVRSLAS